MTSDALRTIPRNDEGVRSSEALAVCVLLLSCFTVDAVVVVSSTLLLVGSYHLGKSVLGRFISLRDLPVVFITVLHTTFGLIAMALAALVVLPVVEVRWSASLLLSAGLLLGLRTHSRSSFLKFCQSFRATKLTPSRDSIALLLVTLVFLGRDFRWANLSALGVGLGLIALNTRRVFFLGRLTGVVAATGVFALGLVRRGELWWFVSNDHHWFEALSTSTSLFGPWDTLGINMDIGLRYHFLTYLIAGMLSELLGLEAFVALTRILPVLIALAVSATVISLLNGLRRFSVMSTTFAAISMAVLLSYSHASPSHTFSMLLLLLTVGIVLFGDMAPNWSLQIGFGVVWAMAVALAKASAIPALLAGLIGLFVVDLFRHQRVRILVFVMSFVTVGSLYVLWQLVSDRTAGQLQTGVLFGYAYERMGDLQTLGNTRLGIVAALLVTSSLFLPISVAAFAPVNRAMFNGDFDIVERLRWFALPVSTFGVLTAILRGNFSIGYFVTAALYVMFIPGLVVICSAIDDAITSWGIVRTLLFFTVIPILAQLLRLQIRPAFNGGERIEVFVRSVLYTSWVLPIAAVATLSLIRVLSRSTPTVRLVPLFVVWSVGVLLAPTVFSPNTLEKGPDLEPEQISLALGSVDEIGAGTWIRLNTSKQAVFATNHFCGSRCAGPGWFEADLNLPRTGYRLSPSDTEYGGANFFLAIYSERRFLAQGPYHLLTAGASSILLRDRIETALKFADSSSQESKASLIRLGATHVIIDRRVTPRQQWPLAREVFRNATFSVLELTT